MTIESPLDDQVVKPRPKRYISHALVEIRWVRWLPIFCHSGVLLDLSTSGFKIEFTGEVEAAPGKQYWLVIPLAPLGIHERPKLTCRCEVRWFDDQRYRIGGVFVSLDKEHQLLLEQVVNRLKTRGQL